MARMARLIEEDAPATGLKWQGISASEAELAVLAVLATIEIFMELLSPNE